MALNEGILNGFPPANGWRRLRKVIKVTQDIVLPSDWEPWMGLEATVVAGGTNGTNGPGSNGGSSGSGINDLVYGLVAGQRITCTVGAANGGTSSFGSYLTATSSTASGGSSSAIIVPGLSGSCGSQDITDSSVSGGAGANGPFGLGVGGPGNLTGFSASATAVGFGAGGGSGPIGAGTSAPGVIILEWWSQAPWGGGREGIGSTTSGQNME